jgi:hypothetical protein
MLDRNNPSAHDDLMQIRDLSSHRNGVFEFEGLVLELGPRRAMVLSPDPTGKPIKIELDAALTLEDDMAALLAFDPRVYEMGLRPLGGVDIITCRRPVRPLSLWVLPPTVPVALESETAIATVVFVPTVSPRGFYNDPNLDIGEEEESEEGMAFFIGFDET